MGYHETQSFIQHSQWSHTPSIRTYTNRARPTLNVHSTLAPRRENSNRFTMPNHIMNMSRFFHLNSAVLKTREQPSNCGTFLPIVDRTQAPWWHTAAAMADNWLQQTCRSDTRHWHTSIDTDWHENLQAWHVHDCQDELSSILDINMLQCQEDKRCKWCTNSSPHRNLLHYRLTLLQVLMTADEVPAWSR